MRSDFATFHPIVNFTYFAVVIVVTMFSMHPLFLAMTFLASFLYSCMLGGIQSVRFNFRFMVPIILLTAVINPFFTHHGVTVLFYLNGNAMTLESILYGMAAAVMLTSVIIWFSCYHVIMTSDKFIYLFGRVIPVMSLALSICLRFVPMLRAQYHEIAEGQKSLGRDFAKQGFFRKIRQFAKIISILITWSMENAMEMSASMRARGYGLKGRSSFHIFRFDRRDAAALGLIAGLSALVIWGCVCGDNDILYYPAVVFPAVTPRSVLADAAYGLLLAVPIAIDIKGELTWKLLSSRM